MLQKSSPLLVVLALAASCATPPPDEDGDGSQGDGADTGDGDGGGDGDGNPIDVDPDSLVWREANLTTFISYPEEGSEECQEFSGCDYKGQFAAFDYAQTEQWVMDHNIVAVHGNDFATYELKTLRIRQDGLEIDAVVYDLCSDSDCDGCCTRNASETGFLIDMESYTASRFGSEWGVVEWACLDC